MSTSLRTDTGDIALPRVVVTDFNRVILQTIIDGLKLWRGEWFLDTNAGFPWSQIVFGVKLLNTNRVTAALRSFLLSVTGVQSVQARSTFNRAERQFKYIFWATLNNGAVITGGSGIPFSVSTGVT